ncbi:MAG: amidohydrolase family protein, partial [Acidobacteria bacterium]|nr:amidohydrolase family protein [Acidobacteriota bacterium]
YHRRMAPAVPARLAAAGVPLAFYSDGLATPTEIFKNIRKAIDAGLSNQQALAALTSEPAQIFGVADRLGTIKAGKIANLVLATDWPWAEDAEIKAVFVDGLKYEERVSDEPTEPPAMDVSGVWALTISTPRGSQDVSLELTMEEDGKVTGETVSERGTTALEEGRMSGDLLRFKTTRTMGPRTFTSSWSLTVEDETLSGFFSAGPMSMDVTGERTSGPDEDEDEESADEPKVTLEEMEASMALYQGPAARMGAYALTHATVWTVSGDTISDGTVLVRDGKIAAVGRDVKIPGGMEIIDAGGGHLIPGIIDAHSHITIEGGGNEGSLAVTSMVSIGDVLNPDDIAIYRALAGGVTTVNVLHGSANPIGGQNQVIKLRWGGTAEDLKFKGAPPGIKFALGENPKRSNFRVPGRPQRYPQTRMGVMDVIRQAFTEARTYQKEWQQYETAVATSSSRRGRVRGSSSTAPLPPRRDFKLEALVEILEGKRLVHSHCYRADEIVQLMRLAEEFGFHVATLQHVLEGYKVADEIAAHGAGASTFSDWWGYKMEAYDAIPYNAALMTRRGVLVSINSDSGEEMRHLNQEAAKSMKWGGLSELEALKLVTLNPALQLHIADRVGSIEVGKDADLVLYDRNPLSLDAVVQKTFVDGDLYFDREADRIRQDSIDAIKAKLAPEEKEEEDEDSEDSTEDTADTPPSRPSPEVIWQEQPYTCREERS